MQRQRQNNTNDDNIGEMMGHSPPQQPVAPAIPSLKWPAIWIVVTGYILIADIIDFTVDREADAGDALRTFPVCIGFLLAALWFYKRRLAQREEWREQRFRNALDKVWPPAPVTDWDKFEYDVAQMVAEQERPRAQKDFGGVKRTPPGTSNHGVKHPVESHHVEWAKGGAVQRGDWWAR